MRNSSVVTRVPMVGVITGLLLTFVPYIAASPASAATTFTETTGGATNTWSDYTDAGGVQGATISAFTSVQVTCAVSGFKVADGDTWWYQIASSPWNNAYYASADAFYNNGQTSGSLAVTPYVDSSVPLCSNVAGGIPETTGGVTHTWTDYTNAGGTQGPDIASNQTVQVACAVQGFQVADGDTWWYRIASSPWNNTYYASADAFYNNGQTSGSLIGTPFVDPAVPLCSNYTGGGGSGGSGGGSGASGITEREGSLGVNTFENYQNASGLGQKISAGSYVQVSCKVYAPTIPSVSPDGYWYLIASSPWDNQYWAPANTFLNGDPWGGPYTHNTDFSVPDCGNAARAGGPTVSLAQGPAAPYGYRYAVTLSGFSPNTTVSVECYDSVSYRGFYQFDLTTDGSGAAFTQSWCYSADGPDHWVVVNGAYASNQVVWGSNGGGSSGVSSPAAGVQGVAPPLSQNSTTCSATAYPVNCGSGAFWHTFSDFSIPGRGVPLQFTRTYSSGLANTDGPLGFGWTDSYNMFLSTDTAGDVVVHQENGSEVTFTSSGSGGFTAPSWVLATLVPNADGTYTLTRDQTSVQYVFLSNGRLLREVDRNGYVTSLGYTGSNLTSITDPAGRNLNLSYVGSQISQIVDPLGRTLSFQYDAGGDLVAVTMSNSGTWTFTYDAEHRLLTMTNPDGGVTTNVYDSSGRVVSQTDPDNLTTTFSYSGDNASAVGGVTTMTDPNGDVTTYEYKNLELLSVTHAAGTTYAAITTYTYDPVTLGIATSADSAGHTTSYTYDSQGNVTSKTDALGRTTSTTYNSFNEPLTVTDPLGNTTTYTYDGHGNMLTMTNALGHTTTFIYGDTSQPGDVTSVTYPDGNSASYTYDAAGNVSSSSLSPSPGTTDTTTYAYNADGELTCTASANATNAGIQCAPGGVTAVTGTTSMTYDSIGDVLSVTNPLGQTTSYTYDLNGDKLTTADPLGHTTTYAYDADGRLLRTTYADGTSTTSTYDGNGNLLTTTDANGNVTTDTYNALNELTSTTNPLNETTSFTYDSAGNLASRQDALGRTTRYLYDADSEVTRITYSSSDTPDVTYVYDADGRRVSMTDGTGTSHYTYDAVGQLTSTTDGAGQTLGYGYDGNGNVTALTYPNGKTVTRTYDGAGNLASVADWLGHTSTFTYDANQNLITQVTGSTPAVTDTYTYDPNNGLTSITDTSAAGTVLQGFTYTRNADSMVSSVTPTGGTTQTYSYDSLNRLTADAQGSYTYDQVGNLTGAITPHTMQYNAGDQLTGMTVGNNTVNFTYDQLGNRTSTVMPNGKTSSYTYSQANRLVNFRADKISATYAYNGDGLRTSKTVASTSNGKGTTSVFAWDVVPSTPLILSDGNYAYIYGPNGLPLEAISNGGTISFLHHDQLGSTTLITSLTGSIVTTFTYSSWGKLNTGNGSIPLMYAGQYYDVESSLYYMRARYYDANTAQFMSVDPAVSISGMPYGYVADSPLNSFDPMGSFHLHLSSIWNTVDYMVSNSLDRLPLVSVAYSAFDGAAQTAWSIGTALGDCQFYGWSSNTCSNAAFNVDVTALIATSSTLLSIVSPTGAHAFSTVAYGYEMSGGFHLYPTSFMPLGNGSYGPGCGSISQSSTTSTSYLQSASFGLQGSTTSLQGGGVTLQGTANAASWLQ